MLQDCSLTFELAALKYRERLKLGVRLKRTGFVQNGFKKETQTIKSHIVLSQSLDLTEGISQYFKISS